MTDDPIQRLRPAVFLDRDGTINEDVGYLSALQHLTIYPWAIDAIRLLNRAGYLVVVVTNQGGIGRGVIAADFVPLLHRELERRLATGGATIDGWYYCPHHPEALVESLRADCRCRKPATGLALDAARDLGIDLTRSWVIGDKWSDVQLGQRVGGRVILVRTGWGVIEEGVRPEGQTVDAICDTLAGAVAHLLQADSARPDGEAGERGRLG
jgi:D-glycero-D-manno-heptose 1,7-bisphosphate phosphatase